MKHYHVRNSSKNYFPVATLFMYDIKIYMGFCCIFGPHSYLLDVNFQDHVDSDPIEGVRGLKSKLFVLQFHARTKHIEKNSYKRYMRKKQNLQATFSWIIITGPLLDLDAVGFSTTLQLTSKDELASWFTAVHVANLELRVISMPNFFSPSMHLSEQT
ncbi:hypothetical protein ACJX0J_034641, partial [Zea mays]